MSRTSPLWQNITSFIEKYGTEEQLAKQVRERIKEWDFITNIF